MASGCPINTCVRWVRADAPHTPTLAESVEILLHELGARLILQELHLLLELKLSDLFLATIWALFPLDLVQFQLMLDTIELLLKLELIKLPLRLVQLLRAWLCCQIGATACLIPKLVKLPLRLTEFLDTIELIKLFALVEFVDLLLLDRLCPLFSELVSRRPVDGRSQKKSRQQQTYSNGTEQFHRRTSFAL